MAGRLVQGLCHIPPPLPSPPPRLLRLETEQRLVLQSGSPSSDDRFQKPGTHTFTQVLPASLRPPPSSLMVYCVAEVAMAPLLAPGAGLAGG